MNIMTNLGDMARSAGDPKVLSTGPSSLGTSDQLARALGWLSIGLGLAELLAPARITRTLGMEGRENLVRAYGAREVMSGILSLSVDKHVGLWSRVAGDGMDMATLATALGRDNPKRNNVALALAAVAGVAVLDVVVAQGVTARHSRKEEDERDYRDRSGFPRGVQASRGLARQDFQTPPDMRAVPVLAFEARRPSAF